MHGHGGSPLSGAARGAVNRDDVAGTTGTRRCKTGTSRHAFAQRLFLRAHESRRLRRRGGIAKLTGVSAPIGLGGASWEPRTSHEPTPALRTQLTAACDLLAKNGAGLLLTLDEIHHQQVPELREVATVLQHLVREEKEIAFVGAGLPSAVSTVLNDDVLTFLRRADRHSLGRVPIAEVAVAITEPIERAERHLSAELAAKAAEATSGYPFFIPPSPGVSLPSLPAFGSDDR